MASCIIVEKLFKLSVTILLSVTIPLWILSITHVHCAVRYATDISIVSKRPTGAGDWLILERSRYFTSSCGSGRQCECGVLLWIKLSWSRYWETGVV